MGRRGSTAVTLLKDFSRRMAVWVSPREATCNPGRDLDLPGLDTGDKRAPSSSGDSGEGDNGRWKVVVSPGCPRVA